MKVVEKMGDAENENEGLDLILDATAISLSKERPEFYNSEAKEGEHLYTDALEEIIDTPTMYEILDVCAGIKLNDPNLLKMAQEALMAEQAGQNST